MFEGSDDRFKVSYLFHDIGDVAGVLLPFTSPPPSLSFPLSLIRFSIALSFSCLRRRRRSRRRSRRSSEEETAASEEEVLF